MSIAISQPRRGSYLMPPVTGDPSMPLPEAGVLASGEA